MKKEKKVFLSATYKDIVDCIEEIKSKLAGLGIRVMHFKDSGFHDGTIKRYPHDICIDKAIKTSNYLLILDRRAGQDYKGKNKKYRGLTVTHAEFRAFYNVARRRGKNRKMYLFVRKNVKENYNLWKQTKPAHRKRIKWEAEKKLFQLLEDIENKNLWYDDFATSLELKEKLDKQSRTFI